MQHDLFRSAHDLDLRSYFQHEFYGYIIVHSTRLYKRNTIWAKNMVPLLRQELLPKNVFPKNGYF